MANAKLIMVHDITTQYIVLCAMVLDIQILI